MSNAERMWYAWLNMQGSVFAEHNSPETLAAMKYAFIAGFEMARSLPTEADRRDG
jgi:hypothetical protein